MSFLESFGELLTHINKCEICKVRFKAIEGILQVIQEHHSQTNIKGET